MTAITAVMDGVHVVAMALAQANAMAANAPAQDKHAYGNGSTLISMG